MQYGKPIKVNYTDLATGKKTSTTINFAIVLHFFMTISDKQIDEITNQDLQETANNYVLNNKYNSKYDIESSILWALEHNIKFNQEN